MPIQHVYTKEELVFQTVSQYFSNTIELSPCVHAAPHTWTTLKEDMIYGNDGGYAIIRVFQ